jgi:hypothetical protein
MARLTGFTREWVAKIAPRVDPAAAHNRLPENPARGAAES